MRFGFIAFGVAIRLCLVANDQRNAPVGWIQKNIRFAQSVVGKAAHLNNLSGAETALAHRPPGSIGSFMRRMQLESDADKRAQSVKIG